MAEIPSLVTAADPAPASTEAAPAEVGHKVFAGNLAYTTTDEGLKAFFSSVESDILSAQVIYRGTRSAGYGFVAFKTLEAAQKAVAEFDKKELDGRTVIIEIAKPTEEKDKDKSAKRAAKKRAGRRGGKAAPPGEVSEAEANGTAATAEKDDKAEKKEGATEGKAAKPKKKKNPRKPRNKAATTPPTGDATPAAEGAAAAATDAAEPKKKAKKAPRAPRAPRPVGEAPQGEPSQTMLFVANLGFSVDDAGLSELFTSAGINVVSARVVRRRWGQPRRSKGYGFVDVGSAEEQKKAIELLQGKDVGGREIAVKIAVNAPPKDDEKGDEKGEEKRDATPEATVVAT